MIAQPVRSTDGDFTEIDVAAHLVYSLGFIPAQDSFSAFVKAFKVTAFFKSILDSNDANSPVMAIKNASASLYKVTTNGAPLGAHIGLQAETASATPDGPLGRLVVGLLKAAVNPNFMTNLSFMGLHSGGPEPWIFFGGTLEPPPSPEDLESPQRRSQSMTFLLKGVFPSSANTAQAIALSYQKASSRR